MTAQRATIVALATLVACSPPTESIEDLGRCGSCHRAIAQDFAGSAHASSAASPVFRTLLEEARGSWGEFAATRCVRCHEAPVMGTLSSGHVGCVTCHGSTGNRGERDGRLTHDLALPPASPPGGAAPHALRHTAWMGDDGLCGTCHEVTGPELFVERTLTEHRDSGHPRPCVDCHMPEGSHRFIGFDPPYAAGPEERERRAAETRELLAEALRLELERDGEEWVVTVTNVGASHSVPTGVAFLRDIWVRVMVGEERFERVLELSDQPTKSGRPVALPTDGDAIEHRGLRFGEAREARLLAPGGHGAEALLLGRAIRVDALVSLGLDPELVPVHLIAHLARAPASP